MRRQLRHLIRSSTSLNLPAMTDTRDHAPRPESTQRRPFGIRAGISQQAPLAVTLLGLSTIAFGFFLDAPLSDSVTLLGSVIVIASYAIPKLRLLVLWGCNRLRRRRHS